MLDKSIDGVYNNHTERALWTTRVCSTIQLLRHSLTRTGVQ